MPAAPMTASADALAALAAAKEGAKPIPERVRPPIEIIRASELAARPEPDELITNVLVERSLALLVSSPGKRKTFLALDMAMRLAHGMDWHGHTTRKCGVLYTVGEGVGRFGRRTEAWWKHHGIADPEETDLFIVPRAAQLKDEADLLSERAVSLDCGLVVIDTWSRSTVGFNENDNSEVAALIETLATEIQRNARCAVLILHHTPHETLRARGATALTGAVDTELVLSTESGKSKLSFTKQRDLECRDDMWFDWQSVEIREDPVTMLPITSLVPVLGDAPSSGVSDEEAVVEALRTIGAPATVANITTLTGFNRWKVAPILEALVKAGRAVENPHSGKRAATYQEA